MGEAILGNKTVGEYLQKNDGQHLFLQRDDDHVEQADGGA